MAIRIAQGHGIPVLNMGVLHPRTVCERLERIRIAAPRTVRGAAPMQVGGAQ